MKGLVFFANTHWKSFPWKSCEIEYNANWCDLFFWFHNCIMSQFFPRIFRSLPARNIEDSWSILTEILNTRSYRNKDIRLFVICANAGLSPNVRLSSQRHPALSLFVDSSTRIYELVGPFLESKLCDIQLWNNSNYRNVIFY